jgi:glucokinase
MDLLLVGDIGGTNARIAIAYNQDNKITIKFMRTYASAAYNNFIDILEDFFQQSGVAKDAIAAVCFAVAGPIIDCAVKFTNLSWQLSEAIIHNFVGDVPVRLLNDFAAVAYGLDYLTQDELKVINKAKIINGSMRSVIGAGTGLGLAHLYPRAGKWIVQTTEGGHVDFAPVGEMQIKLLQYLSKRLRRVSVERVLSGYGIVNIYQFLLCTEYQASDEDPELKSLLVADIEHGAKYIATFMQKNIIAKHTFDIFMQVYAATIGNLALSMLPYGGLYIAGGIAPKLLDAFSTTDFQNALFAKGRVSGLLLDIPIFVVLQLQVGLFGSAHVANELMLQLVKR